MAQSKNTINYQTLSTRLDEVLTALQSPDITIDEAVQLHKEGSDIIVQLEKYLKSAENQITKIKST